MVKKNYLGGLKVLLSLLFIMLLNMGSTCYAYVSQEYVDYALDNLYENVNTVSTGGYTHANLKNIMAYMKTQNVNLFTRINSMLDYYNIADANDLNCIFLISDGTDYSWINIVIANNSSPNGIENLGFLRLASETFCSNDTDYIYGIRFVARTTSLSEFSNFQINNTNNKQWNANRNGYSWNQEMSVVTFTNLSACGLPAIYSYNPMTNNVLYTSNLYPCILKDSSGNYQIPHPEPEEPSGDIGTGGTGIITNPSGEVTGQIDLSGIENGIKEVKDTISGEGQAIRDTISGESEKIINSITNTETDFDVSGEMRNITSATNRVVDPTTNFFSWLLDNLRTVLNSTGNYDLEISLFGETYIIRSDFFVLPDGDLKDFLQMAFIAWFAWDVIKKIRYIVYAIKCVNISSALNQVDFNPNIL